jgi:hypothetical protein
VSAQKYYSCICSDRWPNRSDCGEHGEPDPWPWDWEQRPEKDTCAHDWQVYVTPNGSGGMPEPVLRCKTCHTPCCSNVSTFLSGDPCIERRHHKGLHIYESGSFASLGGIL